MPHRPRCKLLLLAEIPVSGIQVSFCFPHFFLHGRPASNWLTCSWGIIRSRCILYASSYQARPVKRAPGGAAAATAYRFCPERIEQSISALMLRRIHSRQLHAGASFAEMAARSFTGLERKGGRCCTAPFRYAGQPVSKFPGFHGKQPRRRRGLAPFAALPPIRSALRHIKAAPLLRCRAAYLTPEKNYALYQQHRFSRSACTPHCNRCTVHTGQRLF